MAEQPARKAPKAQEARVVRTERLTPHMVRIVLGGEGLADFAADEFTDHYIKLIFPAPGVTYPEPFDMTRIREEFPREQWPTTRTYTVRAWDSAQRELTVDFVVHGDEGLAGPWAARAEVGETVRFLGPGGGYAPDPAADWHLLVGDESALPAIAASLERLPEGAVGHAFIEVESPAEEQKIALPAGVELRWLHRSGRPVGDALLAAVQALDFPPGDVHAFVHGEAGFVKDLRRHLRLERQVPRERLSISGYWRLGKTDEAWRAIKRDWNEQVEREQETRPTAA
ncbi:siderophore-interacting protein [Streptomyces sp. WAC05374]|uniref:siderophore-interacting protein n=1 Tax=Streptomyces sp. WAC05374 TaxID=2487420 RepID=UPI000F8729F3|nr:siderophore-interacting protein [Streptomyces sp. WAC05374]RST17601.1 siderophore-interacting protein [Streptomyces sp. WAC05374]TDF36744.1 siderophore-interacting protein [Streptomyces sp. WAC05374]TDF45828.1 siderophore-interacting protein [Streptomyces sp. WAC05374]TDF51494.1 siderophore-interacting protein [Streptomyces sp. WAC05374]